MEKIVCNNKIEDEFIEEYRSTKNCTFNIYLKKYLQEEKKSQRVEILVKLHDNFHEYIFLILEKQKENKKIKTKDFKLLSTTHERFLVLLNKISHSLEFIKYQFDTLTSSWSRDIFIDLLKKEHLKSKRDKNTFSLVFLDVDYFKKINDIYGHDAGDYILKELVILIKGELRYYDTIARWGGEEFLLLLNQSTLKNSYKTVKRIKKTIQNKIFLYKNIEIKITCSFGIAENKEEIEIEEMINKADELMYKAKQNGRNAIEI